MKKALIYWLTCLLFGANAGASSNDVDVNPPSQPLIAELASKQAIGAGILRKYVGSKPGFDPVDIDAAIASWARDSVARKESASEMVDALGAFLGDYLVKKHGLEWMVYSDGQGSDLCVIDKQVFVYSFPHSAIYKAVVQGRRNALTEVEAALVQQINQVREDPKVQQRDQGRHP